MKRGRLTALLLLPALVSAEATFLAEPIADAVAATVILQNYLDYRRLHKPEI